MPTAGCLGSGRATVHLPACHDQRKDERLGTDVTRRGDRISRLLAARTLPLDHAGALIAREVYTRLRGLGLDIGVRDSLLAGTCLRFDLPLATRNIRHFAQVEGLRLVD